MPKPPGNGAFAAISPRFRRPRTPLRPACLTGSGISLVPLIEGSMQKRPRPIGFQFGKQASFSGNRFKLIHNANEKRSRSDNGSVPTMKYELYDLINDPRETVNVAEKHPEVVVDMRRRLDQWMASCRASQQGRDYLQQD